MARTVLDLADVVDVSALRKAIERSEKLDLFDYRAIQAVLSAHPGRRTRKLAAALGEADFAFVRSDLESDFLQLCRTHGLPRPEVNVEVGGFEVDFFFRSHRLVVEADSWTHHRSRAAFERDRRRDVELARLGMNRVRFTHDRIAHEAAGVADDLGSLLSL